MSFATIDIVFACLVLILTIRCLLRGFIEEFMSMAALVVGLALAFFLFQNGAQFLRERVNLQTLPELVAFVGLFLIGFVIVKILERIFRDILDKLNLSALDKLLGALLGVLEGLLVVGLILLVLDLQPLFDASSLLEGSVFSKYLMPFIQSASDSVSTIGSAGNIAPMLQEAVIPGASQ